MANIKRNLAYNFLLSLSQVLFPAITIPYISRVLDTTGIGLVSQVDSFSMYMVTLAEAGITAYAIRAIASSVGLQRKQLVHELISLHLVTTGITFIIYAAGLVYIWQSVQDIRLVVLSVIFYLMSAFSCEWYFIGTEQFKFIAIRSIVLRIIGALAIFGFIVAPFQYPFYYAVIVFTSVALQLVNIVALLRKEGFSFTSKNYQVHLKPITITFFISIFYAVPVMLDSVLLGLVTTATVVGLYAFPVKLVRLTANLLTDSMQVFYPRVTSLQTSSKVDKEDKMGLNLKLILLLGVPMSMGLLLLANPIVLWVLGPQYEITGSSLKWLAFFPLVKGLSLYYSNTGLLAHHKERYLMWALLISAIVYCILVIMLGYLYEDTGASIALIIAEMVLLLLVFKAFYIHIPDAPGFNFRTFFVAVAGAIFFIPLVYLVKVMKLPLAYECIISILLCTFCYIPFALYGLRVSLKRKIEQS